MSKIVGMSTPTLVPLLDNGEINGSTGEFTRSPGRWAAAAPRRRRE
jgi:hypothetical protein